MVLALLTLIFLGPGASVAQDNKGPIRIGIDTELSGVVSESGTNNKMGYDLYLQEIGYKVAGRDIKIIENDNRTDYRMAMEPKSTASCYPGPLGSLKRRCRTKTTPKQVSRRDLQVDFVIQVLSYALLGGNFG